MIKNNNLSIYILLLTYVFLISELSYSQEEKIPEDLLSEAPLTEIPKPSKPEKEKSVKPEQDETKEKPTNDSRVSQDQKIKTPPAAESEPEKKVQVVTAPSPSETAPSTIEPKEDGSESTTPTTTLYSDNKLIIRALEPVTAEITWADGYIQKILMKEQESKTLVFTSPIQVRLSNGGVVNINFNQKDQGVPGPLNQPIELKFP